MNLNNDEPKTTEDFINKQLEEEWLKDLDNLKPIDHGTLAKPHTPIYKMHRYFARRPYSVFNELVKHYSNPGSIILDPFCGGGVTVVESLRLRRKVIGVDLNPMATFITRMEVIDVDLNELEKEFKEIEKNVKGKILKLYEIKCSNCKKQTYFDWMEWDYGLECPSCKSIVNLNAEIKVGYGIYECPKCKTKLIPRKCKKKGDVPKRLSYICRSCKNNEVRNINKFDEKVIQDIEENFDNYIKKEKLWYPTDNIPLGKETNKIIKRGFTHFYKLFTKRNLYVISLLFKEINKIKDITVRQLLLMVFTSTFGWTSKMNMLRYGSTPGGWGKHSYWVPGNPLEQNAWLIFENRYQAMHNGKEFSNKEVNDFYKESKDFTDLKKGNTCLLVTKSSTSFPLPDKSVDVIITDPPYGGNVNYTELSDFWAVWLRDILNIKKNEFIDNQEEAIVNEYQKKKIKDYRDLMFKIFKECNRVLKSGRWMIMTFHNKNFHVWNALNLAAHDAGFILSEDDGMIYQPPIQSYVTTAHTRKQGGSMLGDFVLSFQKTDKPPKIKMLEEIEMGNKVRKISAETIQYHGGAKLSTIYMRLVPFLLNNGLLHKIGEQDITKFLKQDFEEKKGVWYFKENIEEVEGIKPLDYIPVDSRIEYLIRSLLYDKKEATMDEILNAIFSNLINGNAAEYEEIDRVLKRIAERKQDGRHWQLKELGSEAQKQILSFMEKREKPKALQQTLTGEELTTEESIHDLMIKQLAALGEDEGYSSHIGQTEQRKYVEFRKMSIPMGNNVQYGLNRQAFDIIREIDLLWLKGDTIVIAFEIEKSTTIDSGINRFRNLFAATPNQNIPAYIVIPDNREKEAINKIGSLANRKDNLHKKIKYLLFSDIKNKKGIKIEEKAKEVI